MDAFLFQKPLQDSNQNTVRDKMFILSNLTSDTYSSKTDLA